MLNNCVVSCVELGFDSLEGDAELEPEIRDALAIGESEVVDAGEALPFGAQAGQAGTDAGRALHGGVHTDLVYSREAVSTGEANCAAKALLTS